MLNEFKSICKMSQKDLKKYVAKQLEETHEKVIVDDGFVYAQGKFPVLLVAHMDTVHKKLPQFFLYDTEKKALSSPQGIGGDDRCGVYMIFKVIKKYNCSVLFCEDEEIGMVGAGKFVKSDLAKDLQFNYIIEFDRRGSNDAVFYDCDNPEFEEFITKEFYQTSFGSFSDISTIAPALGCAAVNLSCGYYNAHTKDEYVVMEEMENSIYVTCKILDRTTDEDKFEYIEAEHSYHYGEFGWDDYFGYDYKSLRNKDMYYMFEYIDENGDSQWWDTLAANRDEAVGAFCIDNPRIPYIDIIDICVDEYDYY